MGLGQRVKKWWNTMSPKICQQLMRDTLKMPVIAVSAAISSNQLLRIRFRLETTATLQVDIEDQVAPAQFVVWISATSFLKYQSFFTMLKKIWCNFKIQNANKLRRSKEINVIAQNSEKFRTCGLEHLSIKGCCSVLSSSLEKLVNLNK